MEPTNQSAPPRKATIKQHIFPPDFLRWPPAAKAVRVTSKEHGTVTAGLKVATPIQNPVFSQQFSSPQSNMIDFSNTDETSNLLNGQQNADWWARFKSKFSHKSGYEHL